MRAWSSAGAALVLAACSVSRDPSASGTSGAPASGGSAGEPGSSNADGGTGAGAAGAGGDTSAKAGAGGAAGEAGRFVPPDGQRLLIIGQDLGSIQGYTDSVWSSPGGVTTYTRIEPAPPYLPGLSTPINEGAGDLHATELLARYPDSVLALGLYLVDHTGSHLAQVADGTLDPAIDELGAFISEAQRPVFLRIGYEFDGSWNHYEPGPYQAAFRHIVERLRQQSVKNFASVWQSATYALGTYKNLPIDAWYPGDDVVDWCGSSFFKFSEAPHRALLDFARAHGKPVMIAEAAPQGYDLEELTYSDNGVTFVAKSAQQIWEEWYSPLFSFAEQNADVVRAVAYIDCDWASQPMWGPSGANGYWGDTRLEVSAEIETAWLAEMQKPFWLHGSPHLVALLE